MQLPGMRIFKSALAVFLVFLVSMLRDGAGIPFYSAIAAIICMQPLVSGSIRTAASRTIATLLGGFSGMLFLVIRNQFFGMAPYVIQYLLISACIIPLIYITVLLRWESAAYITCVVFLSVTVSHGMDVSPVAFALNRILDTLIGIFISLVVNAVHLPQKGRRDILFVSDMGGTLLRRDGKLSSRTKALLGRMLASGVRFTVTSARTPATMVPLLEDLKLTLPIIALSGAVLYDIKSAKYICCQTIPYQIARQVLHVFEENSRGCLTYIVNDERLTIYYTRLHNEAERRFFGDKRDIPLKTHVLAPPPVGQDVVYMVAIDTKEVVEKICHAVLSMPCGDELSALIYDDVGIDDYYTLEIFSAYASKQNAVDMLRRQLGLTKVVAFADNLNDIPLIKGVTYGFAMKNAHKKLIAATEHVTRWDNNHDGVVRTIASLLRSRTFFEGKKE